MIQNLINHVGLAVDESSSMAGQPVEEVFDAALERLKQQSINLNQETRISIYKFADRPECIAFDMDVMRFKTLRGFYKSHGQTALIDAVIKQIQDHKKLPELYGDHAFLMYAITDGQENNSRLSATQLKIEMNAVNRDNWTFACLVPDHAGKVAAKAQGFSDESIAIWNTAAPGGLEKVGKQFTQAMDNYMTARASGLRSTSSLFSMDASALQRNQLDRVDPRAYKIYNVYSESRIDEYVEKFTNEPYRLGSTYYMPTKKVKIQGHKNILVQEVKTGNVYEGDNVRQLLGLPPQTVEVEPADHSQWRIFVQSTSVNRKLFPGTFILVRK